MITFAVKNKYHKRRNAEAWLFYDEEKDLFRIKINKNANTDNLPFILEILFKKGQTEIDDYWSRRFVQDRIVPRERQNIGSILKANGMTEYKEIDMLRLSGGNCPQDDFYLEELKGIEAPNMNLSCLGSAIAYERKSQGITQAQLSKKCNIKQSNLSRIENGICEPSIHTLQVIAQALGKELKINFV